MKKQARLISFKPNMYQGNHQKWNEYFKFDVQFDNGDQGVAMSKKQEGNYTLNANYEYEIQTKTFSNGNSINNVRGMKNLDTPTYQKGSNTGRYKMSPEEQNQIIVQVSMICANTAFNSHNTDWNSLFETFYGWINQNLSKAKAVTVQGVAKIGAAYIEKGNKFVTPEKVYELLNYLLNKVLTKTWNSQQAPGTNSNQSSAVNQQSAPQQQVQQSQPEQTSENVQNEVSNQSSPQSDDPPPFEI